MVASAVFWSELKAGAKVIKCISRTCLASWKWDRRLFSATNYSSNDTVLKLQLSLSTQKQKKWHLSIRPVLKKNRQLFSEKKYVN